MNIEESHKICSVIDEDITVISVIENVRCDCNLQNYIVVVDVTGLTSAPQQRGQRRGGGGPCSSLE